MIEVELKSGTVRLAMTLGALEQVAKVNSKPALLLAYFETQHYELAELVAVIKAGLEAGESGDVEIYAFIDEIGLEPARLKAIELLKSYYKIPEGKTVAVVSEPEKTTA